MDKVLLLDIDKTIINTDSMILFVKYSIKYNKLNILRMPLVLIATILYHLHLMPIETTKSVVYKPINSMSKEDINYFMDNIVMKHKNDELFEIIKKFKLKNYKIIMVTASIETYMVYFKEKGYTDFLFGTRYDKKIIGKNCKYTEKVERLKALNLNIDFENSYAYSDSLTDLPMLDLVKNKFQVVYQNKKAVLKKL
jgi:HAD superfamily phosphoserine phosphatase-like hydrolase